jgi:hypothetical protein
VWFTISPSGREEPMTESDVELRLRLIEEIEFELIVATKTGNSNLVPGLERALAIVEEII